MRPRPKKKERALNQAALAEKYANFQRVLAAHNTILALMADMEEKLGGDFLFDLQYIRASVNQLSAETAALVEAINNLGGHRYGGLVDAFRRIIGEVEDILNRRREIPQAPLTLAFDRLPLEMAAMVGGKIANFEKARNRAGLPAPPGFAITTYAYKAFLDYNQIAARLDSLLGFWRIDDLDGLVAVSEELQSMIHLAQPPPELEGAILEAYEDLSRKQGNRPSLEMHASAVRDDLAIIFAGHDACYLQVPPGEIIHRYQDILAGLFTPRALFYFKTRGYHEEEMALGVAVLPMLDAGARDAIFTLRPVAPPLADGPVFGTLKEVLQKVSPLNLVNPGTETFTPAACRTIHDLARFAHESARGEMGKLIAAEVQDCGEVVDLIAGLPFKLCLLDLGGGLKKRRRRKARPEQIASIPFQAFCQGIASGRQPLAKPTGAADSGPAADQRAEEAAPGAASGREQGYAVFSLNYLNFSLHQEDQHFTVEAYVSEQTSDNFFAFTWRGGSTPEHREGRTRLLEAVLHRMDLPYEHRGGAIQVWITQYPQERLTQMLTLCGKLALALNTSQPDLELSSEGLGEGNIKVFL